MDEKAVITSRDGEIGVITLNRPANFNCISPQVLAGIDSSLDEFESDQAIKVVLIKSTGKHFCTGADLNVVLAGRTGQGEGLAEFVAYGHRVFRRLETSSLPVIAAIQGFCLAGGLELMLSCDIVIAAESAQFSDQHGRYGLVPGWGGTQRLGRLLGARRALDLMLSVRYLDAREAEHWGLVNQVVPDAELESGALAYCQTLAKRNRSGITAMKRLAREGLDLPLQAALDFEQREVVPSLMTDNVTEGLAAFLERREPKFR